MASTRFQAACAASASCAAWACHTRLSHFPSPRLSEAPHQASPAFPLCLCPLAACAVHQAATHLMEVLEKPHSFYSKVRRCTTRRPPPPPPPPPSAKRSASLKRLLTFGEPAALATSGPGPPQPRTAAPRARALPASPGRSPTSSDRPRWRPRWQRRRRGRRPRLRRWNASWRSRHALPAPHAARHGPLLQRSGRGAACELTASPCSALTRQHPASWPSWLGRLPRHSQLRRLPAPVQVHPGLNLAVYAEDDEQGNKYFLMRVRRAGQGGRTRRDAWLQGTGLFATATGCACACSLAGQPKGRRAHAATLAPCASGGASSAVHTSAVRALPVRCTTCAARPPPRHLVQLAGGRAVSSSPQFQRGAQQQEAVPSLRSSGVPRRPACHHHTPHPIPLSGHKAHPHADQGRGGRLWERVQARRHRGGR